MQTTHAQDTAYLHEEGEMNLTDFWLRKDPTRWISGIIGGAIAGVIAMIVAALVAVSQGYEPLFPIKLISTIIVGSSATEFGFSLGNIIPGFIIIEAVAMLWGFAYSHFTFTNRLVPLFFVGIVWGLFLWIFNWCLFSQSFMTIRFAHVTPSAAFPVCLSYGISLALIGVIYPILGGKK